MNSLESDDPRSRTYSFRLLELLVVIGIVLLLAGLMLPSTGHSRALMQSHECRNNLRQVGLAIINYETAHRHLPIAMGGTSSRDSLKGNMSRLSGVISLLPYLEQIALYDQITRPLPHNGVSYPAFGPAPWIAAYPPWQAQVDLLSCPSAPAGEQLLGKTNYAFCIGDQARDIHQPTAARGAFACGLAIRYAQLTDGASNTILMGEIGSADGGRLIGQYAVEQPALLLDNPLECTLRRSSWNRDYYAEGVPLSQFGRGGRWADGSAGDSLFNTILPPNSPSCAVGGSEAVDGLYSAGSYHVGGTHILFGDGSVRAMTAEIDCGDLSRPTVNPAKLPPNNHASPYGVWGALGTAAGGEAISND